MATQFPGAPPSQVFWDPSWIRFAPVIQDINSTDAASWVSFTSLYGATQAGLLLAHLSGPGLRSLDSGDSQGVQAAVLAVLQALVGSSSQVPDPLYSAYMSWDDNPWSLGATSYYKGASGHAGGGRSFPQGERGAGMCVGAGGEEGGVRWSRRGRGEGCG